MSRTKHSPEALLAHYAERVHFQDEDVDYILSLIQMARGLGSEAGANDAKERCASAIDNLIVAPDGSMFSWGDGAMAAKRQGAEAIRSIRFATKAIVPQ